MAIVTGDRYLDRLGRFVEKQAGSLLDGSLVLKLNPVGLHYVQTRLDALHELERLRIGAPVDYLRAYISDLGDHRALEQLSRFLSLLPAVKVVSVLPSPKRDPCPLTLLPFGRLRSLEIRGCDLSTSPARGLLQLRPILERLVCHNSADALRHIFTERIQEVEKSQVWSRLAFVSCSNNDMVLMDDSLQLLPAVQSLDLSRNRFVKAANLHCCSKLTYLDLGFNQLRNISSLKQVTSQITKLVLKNNALVNVHGIAALTSLEALDLSNNLISKFNEIHALATIPALQIIFLEGNPISTHTIYREEVYSFFPNPTMIYLDGIKVSKSELWRVNKIISRRQQFETLYGSYNPARQGDMQVDLPHASHEGNNAPRRKLSRLALIQDVEMVMDEVEDDESPGFPIMSSHSRDVKERRQLPSDESEQQKLEAIQLMQKAEALKMENSINWLQELRLLLDNNELPAGQEAHPKYDLQNEKSMLMRDLKLQDLRKFWRRRKRQQYKTSMGDLTDVQESKKNLEKEMEHDKHMKDNEENSSLSKGVSTGILSSVTSSRMSATSNVYSDIENSAEFLKQSDMKNIDETRQNGLYYEEQNKMSEGFGSWKIIDEVVESQGRTGDAMSSPPHYHKDVLQKRQDLEDELIQNSLSSDFALSSSESESSIDATSSSSSSNDGDHKDLMEFQKEKFELNHENIWKEQPSISNQVEDGKSNYSSDELLADYQKKSNGVKMVEAHTSVTTSVCSDLPKEKSVDTWQINNLNPISIDDIRANGDGQNQAISEMRVTEARQKKPRKARMAQLCDESHSVKEKLREED